MRHVIQGRNECFLATYSMLSGVDFEEIKRVACQAVGVKKWNSVFRRGNLGKFNIGIQALQKKWPMPCMYTEEEKREIGFYNIPNGSTMQARTPVTRLSRLQNADLSGKGYISMRRKIWGGHAVAFENNLIYDSNELGPISKEEYITKNSRFLSTIATFYISKLKEEKMEEVKSEEVVEQPVQEVISAAVQTNQPVAIEGPCDIGYGTPGRWYITMGNPGFNSPANNHNGYKSFKQACDSSMTWGKKGVK